MTDSARSTARVALVGGPSAVVSEAARVAAAARGDVSAALAAAPRLAASVPRFGTDSATRFSVLASLAATDVSTARVLEPDLDAREILAEAESEGEPFPDVAIEASWGVYASEAPAHRLLASPSAGGDPASILSGSKGWCSLASVLDRALVTAVDEDGGRGLYAIDLRHAGVTAADGPWLGAGLTLIPSTSVRFDGVPAERVGGDGWYLRRPGFSWGGIGVAACWWGGTAPLVDALLENARARPDDTLRLARLGRVRRIHEAARLALLDAATRIDCFAGTRDEAAALAHLVRGLAADAVDAVIEACRDSLGPLPLVTDEQHATRIADLELYRAQYHGAADDVALARALLTDADIRE